MGRWDPDQPRHNAEVKSACARLFNVIIPEFVKSYEGQRSSASALDTPGGLRLGSSHAKAEMLTAEELIQAVHRAGINLRHLGVVRQKCSSPIIRRVLHQEMVARVLKGAPQIF